MAKTGTKGDTLRDFHQGQFDNWIKSQLRQEDLGLTEEKEGIIASLLMCAYKRGTIDATIQLAGTLAHYVNDELQSEPDTKIHLVWASK